MNKILKVLAGSIAGLLAVAVIGGLLLPSQFTGTVTATVKAPRSDMYALANSPSTWVQWSAWNLEVMPDMTSTYTGPDSGVGARWAWAQEMGDGSLEITASDPNERVAYTLSFEGLDEPMTGEIRWTAQGEETQVDWDFSGDVGSNLLFVWMRSSMVGAMEEEHQTAVQGLAEAAFAAQAMRAEAEAQAAREALEALEALEAQRKAAAEAVRSAAAVRRDRSKEKAAPKRPPKKGKFSFTIP